MDLKKKSLKIFFNEHMQEISENSDYSSLIA